MTLDKEDHRAILMQLVNRSQFPGEFAEEVILLKKALAEATIAEPEKRKTGARK